MTIRRVTIVGVGLIGGSLGKAWKGLRAEGLHISGADRQDVIDKAVRAGAIDDGSAHVEDTVAEADLIVLATPLSTIMSHLAEIAPRLKRGAVVTDVGSVKGPIVRQAETCLREDVLFVGGHPMAGSELSGIDHASPFLFENATWVLCRPGSAESDPRYADLLDLIHKTGARALELSPREHDDIAALVSHVPQLVAVALTNTVGRRNTIGSNYLRLAAGGFRDMTRIAGSDAGIWRDILTANLGSVLDALALTSAELQRVRNRLIEEDFDDLHALFTAARETRESIPRDTKGFIAPLADVYVHADDRPGWIASIATLLADADINIKDMELLKIREGTGGTFRLSFTDAPTAGRAVELLNAGGFSAYTLA